MEHHNTKNNLGFLFWFLIIITSSLKLWLVSGQDLAVFADALYDDRLFINLAHSLLQGNWLGDYDHLTLIKGPFYPLFIAGSSVLGIPLSIAEHVLYIGACVLFIRSVQPLTSNRIILFISYVLILLHPISYDAQVMPRVSRDGIYVALTLSSWACLIGLFVRLECSLKKVLLWASMFGVFLSAFWLTREEGVWLIPSYLLITVFSLYTICRSKITNKKSRVGLILVPYFFLVFSVGAVCSVNYMKYWIFTTTELKTHEFQAAYNALARPHSESRNRYVHAPQAVRENLYQVSPSFEQIKPALEGNIGMKWQNMLCSAAKHSEKLEENEQRRYKELVDVACTDLAGGWFLWAFRDAVAAKGYHSSAQKAMAYYANVAQEIENACKSEKLSCDPQRVSLSPRLKIDDLKPLVYSAIAAFEDILFFENLHVIPFSSTGSKESLEWVSHILGENVSSSHKVVVNTDQTIRSRKISALVFISKYYSQFHTIFLIISLFVFVFCLIGKHRKISLSIIGFSVMAGVSIRVILLSLIDVKSFPALTMNYLAPIYILCIVFIILNIIYLYSALHSK